MLTQVGRVTPCAPLAADEYHRPENGGQRTACLANIRGHPCPSVVDLP